MERLRRSLISTLSIHLPKVRQCRFEEAVVVVEAVVEGDLVEESYPRWASHLPIFRPCLAKELHYTLYEC